MWNVSFAIDYKALVFLAGLFLIAFFFRQYFASPAPYFLFSNLKNLMTETKQNRTYWLFLPQRLYQASLLLFALAFLDPHLLLPRSPSSDDTVIPKEGIAIYLVLDQSGSMTQNIQTQTSKGYRESITKIQLLKEVTKQFIAHESSNLIGIVAFARVPHVLAPLTLDQEALRNQVDQLQVVQSQEEDGTAMGYAIFKTAHLIAATKHFAETLNDEAKPAYEIKSAVIVVVTDGQQDPNLLDQGNRLRTIELDEAAEYARKHNIHLYIINIDPNFASEQYAPHRRQMERITKLTGGKFYLTSHQQNLEQVYQQIDKLERGTIPIHEQPIPPLRASFYPYLLALGLICFCVASILDLTLLRRVP